MDPRALTPILTDENISYYDIKLNGGEQETS